jgi:negative regulator of sigma E activity
MQTRLNQALEAAQDADCRETLSCLIDGELNQAECAVILDRLCTDQRARHEWVWMHAAGDALRSSEVAALHSNGFLERVSAAVASEPTILAPAALVHRRYRRVLIPGVAVAAAAALLVVVAIPQLRGNGETGQVAATAVTAPSSAATQMVEVARVPELERYLRAHRELAGGAVMPHATPYLRTSNNLPLEPRR